MAPRTTTQAREPEVTPDETPDAPTTDEPTNDEPTTDTDGTDEPEVDEEAAEIARLAADAEAAQARFHAAIDARAARERSMILQQIKGNLVDITKIAHDGGTCIESGDTPGLVQLLTTIITTATQARSVIAPQAARPARGRPAGNGAARASSLRDEAIAVMTDAPGVWFTASQLVKEMSPSPVSGNPRSSAAIGNTLTTFAATSDDIEMTTNPVRFRVPAQADANE